MIKEVINECVLAQKVGEITTNSTSSVVSGIDKLPKDLATSEAINPTRPFSDLHVRFVAQIICVSVINSLSFIHDKKKSAVRIFVRVCSTLTKRRKMFEKIKLALDKKKAVLSSRDVEARWNSTFRMVRKAPKCSIVLNNLCQQLLELSSYKISNEDWKQTDIICQFFPRRLQSYRAASDQRTQPPTLRTRLTNF